MGHLFSYITGNFGVVLTDTVNHAILVLIALGFAVAIGVTAGVVTYRRSIPRQFVVGIASVALTVPSYALFALLIPPLGLGVTPSIVALTIYGLLPITRNTIVGLNSVDPAIRDSARGMGMGALRRLVRIDLPLAWPVIVTGARVSAQLLLGIAAIAAVVNGPGLGKLILDGLSKNGTDFAVPRAWAGTLGVVVLAIIFDIAFVFVGRLTTPRGIR